MRRAASRIARAARATTRFVWDFVRGDAPEPLLTTAGVVALGFALRHERMAAVLLLPIAAAVGLTAGLLREQRSTSAQQSDD